MALVPLRTGSGGECRFQQRCTDGRWRVCTKEESCLHLAFTRSIWRFGFTKNHASPFCLCSYYFVTYILLTTALGGIFVSTANPDFFTLTHGEVLQVIGDGSA